MVVVIIMAHRTYNGAKLFANEVIMMKSTTSASCDGARLDNNMVHICMVLEQDNDISFLDSRFPQHHPCLIEL